MIIKRFFAYAFDIYFVPVMQLLIFSLYRYITTGEVYPSMLYILQNFRILFISNYILYYFITEFLFNKTLGKKIFKLEVVYKNKTLLSILIRSLVRLFPLDLFFILIFKDKVLHDYLSKTLVIDKKKYNK